MQKSQVTATTIANTIKQFLIEQTHSIISSKCLDKAKSNETSQADPMKGNTKNIVVMKNILRLRPSKGNILIRSMRGCLLLAIHHPLQTWQTPTQISDDRNQTLDNRVRSGEKAIERGQTKGLSRAKHDHCLRLLAGGNGS